MFNKPFAIIITSSDINIPLEEGHIHSWTQRIFTNFDDFLKCYNS